MTALTSCAVVSSHWEPGARPQDRFSLCRRPFRCCLSPCFQGPRRRGAGAQPPCRERSRRLLFSEQGAYHWVPTLWPARFWAAPPAWGGDVRGQRGSGVPRWVSGAEPEGHRPACPVTPTSLLTARLAGCFSCWRGWSADGLLRVVGLPGKGAEACTPGPFPVDTGPHEHAPPRGQSEALASRPLP